jgi:hypothetical protein
MAEAAMIFSLTRYFIELWRSGVSGEVVQRLPK